MSGLCTKIYSVSAFVCTCHKALAPWGSCDICIIAIFKASSSKHQNTRGHPQKRIWIWLLWFSFFPMCKTVTEYTMEWGQSWSFPLTYCWVQQNHLIVESCFWLFSFIFQVAGHLPRNYQNLWKPVIFLSLSGAIRTIYLFLIFPHPSYCFSIHPFTPLCF